MKRTCLTGTVLILMVSLLLVSVEATTLYWWDSIRFVEGLNIKYPHPDRDYYSISPFSDWTAIGTKLYHNQINYDTSQISGITLVAVCTIAGAVIGSRAGGPYGSVVGAVVGVVLGVMVAGYMVVLRDEVGCIWWWTSISFVDWIIANAWWLGPFLLNSATYPIAYAAIGSAFLLYGYLRVGGETIYDAVGAGNPAPSPPSGGGGCPYVYTWNGQQYVMDNNLLPASEMGNGVDVEDRYMLEQPLVPSHQGTAFSLYSLQIREFEHEHDFIDQVKLVALDHASDVKIAVTPKGEILTYRQPFAPLSCIDNDGTSRLNEVVSMDGNVSDTTTYFEGYPGDYLILNFGKVDAENAKLVLRDDMKCMEVCIEVQVPSGSGDWQTVEVLNPRNYWAIEAVNLTAYIPEKGDFTVRLLWTAPHRLDYVGLDTTPQDNFKLHYAKLASAIHSTEGNILPKLLLNDNKHAELTLGQQIQLTFVLPNNRNEERTFILYTEGHYITIET